MENEINYHITSKSNLESILENGLIPKTGKNSENVNDIKNSKLCFSEGYIGEILMANNFYYRYTYDKSCNENYDEYIKRHDTMLAFKKGIIENQSNIADGYTTTGMVPTSSLVAVKLVDSKGQETYETSEILAYMMSKCPIEKIIQEMQKSNNLNMIQNQPLIYMKSEEYLKQFSEEDRKSRIDEFYAKLNNGEISFKEGEASGKTTLEFLKEFYEKNREKIKKYDSEKYKIEYQDLREYYAEHNKTNAIFNEQEIGKATVNQPTQNKEKAQYTIIKDEIDIQNEYTR